MWILQTRKLESALRSLSQGATSYTRRKLILAEDAVRERAEYMHIAKSDTRLTDLI